MRVTPYYHEDGKNVKLVLVSESGFEAEALAFFSMVGVQPDKMLAVSVLEESAGQPGVMERQTRCVITWVREPEVVTRVVPRMEYLDLPKGLRWLEDPVAPGEIGGRATDLHQLALSIRNRAEAAMGESKPPWAAGLLDTLEREARALEQLIADTIEAVSYEVALGSRKE